MYTYKTKIRVRYSETDKMGFVYNGNYAQYYEVGRVEMLRSLGMTYGMMEEYGVMMPLIEMNSKFIKPAFYDQEITIKTTVRDLPGARIVFAYELYNEDEELINTGSTTLAFINIERRRPCAPPKYFMDRIRQFFI